ncbi:MAG: hypothetical protein O9327_02150 [Polaromonas sp.]|nr:hypothetical protein [Polaromonas sp.]
MPIDLQEATHEALIGELLRRGALKALGEAVTSIHQAAIGSVQEQLASAASPDATSNASKRLGRAVLALQLELAKVEEMGGGVQRSAFFATTLQEWDADMQGSALLEDQPTPESVAKAAQSKVEISYDQEDVKDVIVSNGLETELEALQDRAAQLLWKRIGLPWGQLWDALSSAGAEFVEREFSEQRDTLVVQAQRELLAERGVVIQASEEHKGQFEWVNTKSERPDADGNHFPTEAKAIEAAWDSFAQEFWPEAALEEEC